MRGHPATLVCALVLLAAACGDDEAVTVGTADHPHEGPLHVTRADAEHPDAGAAGNVVECDTWGDGGVSNAEVYDGGATADSPEQALDVARSEGLWRVAMEGLGVAKREQDRVLYVLEVDGVMKQALIVRDGPATEWAGGPGWYLESWARATSPSSRAPSQTRSDYRSGPTQPGIQCRRRRSNPGRAPSTATGSR